MRNIEKLLRVLRLFVAVLLQAKHLFE